MNKKVYKVGDCYTVIEDCVRLRGKITAIDKQGYHVQWSDGSTSIEDYPDPCGTPEPKGVALSDTRL